MAGKNGNEVGVYVNITPQLDEKLGLISRLLPKKDGKRWFKKDVIAKACELYVERFFALLEGTEGVDEMMARAKEIDPNAIKLEIGEPATEDLPTENAGLREL